ncbi:MAG: glutamate racemase [Actinomycetota bacterium]
MIGMFDSGVGGLSVLLHVRRRLPAADLVYLADTANAPYGSRSLAEVAELAERCVNRLLAAGAEVIVVACNTASAAALHRLRADHPGIPFVGMEPALKPAAALTRSGVVGVLATTATFQGELFGSVVGRFGGEVEVFAQPCPGWADLVETGRVSGPEAADLIADRLDPVLAAGADTLVLGCTHYPFLEPLIAERAGAQVVVVDPSPAVGRQVERIWVRRMSGQVAYGSRKRGGRLQLRATGSANRTGQAVKSLIGGRALAGWNGTVAAVT